MKKEENNDIVTQVRQNKLALITEQIESENKTTTAKRPGGNSNANIIEKHIKDNSFKLNSSLSQANIEKRKKELEKIIAIAPILQLKVINSNSSFEKGKVLTINCQGLENNPSGKYRKDGLVYFGYYPDGFNVKDDQEIDVLLSNIKNSNKNATNNNGDILHLHSYNNDDGNYNNNNENAINIGRHFVIEYSLEKNKYYIKDLGIGYGTFARLDYIHSLKDNQLINLGQIFIVVNITDKLDENSRASQQGNSVISSKSNMLKLRVYGVNNNGDTFYFQPQARNISIGRYELADIKLNDKLLSQIHCVINYNENEGWKLMDGQSNKPSTNGTWVYINEDYLIYERMIFKTNQTIFQAFFVNK